MVELRYFGGLSEVEIVTALKISPGTVRRDWDLAGRTGCGADQQKASDIARPPSVVRGADLDFRPPIHHPGIKE